MRPILYVVTALLSLGPAVVWATPELARGVVDKFAQMDTDSNDKVSWEEFAAAYPHTSREAFEAIDTSGDGFISLEEWQTFSQDHSKDRMPLSMGQPDPEYVQCVRDLFQIVPRNERK
jgi:Ca2+-binding EF-hand superfamily protein